MRTLQEVESRISYVEDTRSLAEEDEDWRTEGEVTEEAQKRAEQDSTRE